MLTRKGNFYRWFVPAAVVFAAGFACAAVYDLPLDIALYSPRNPFGVVMEAVGWFPAFLPVVMYALLLAAPRSSPTGEGQALAGPRLTTRLAGYFVALAGLAAIYWKAWDYLVGREALMPGSWSPAAVVWLALGLLLAVALVLFTHRIKPALRPRLAFWGLWASVFMAANQAVVYLVKLVWQRTRFDTMVLAGMTDFAAFTPWWQPFGNGGSSFPSGHTANAAGVLVLVLLCDLLPAWNLRRKWVYAGCWAYIAAMGFARMLIGRHFLSDVLAAAALMALVFFALRRCPPYKNGLRRLRQQHPLSTPSSAGEKQTGVAGEDGGADGDPQE